MEKLTEPTVSRTRDPLLSTNWPYGSFYLPTYINVNLPENNKNATKVFMIKAIYLFIIL